MSPQNSDLSSSDSNQKTSGIFGSLLNGRFWPMGAVGAAAVAAALWLSAAGLSGPAGELLPAAEAEEEESFRFNDFSVVKNFIFSHIDFCPEFFNNYAIYTNFSL